MKNVIAMVEKDAKNKELLAIENIDKTAMMNMAKVSNAIDFGSKHSSGISNADINAVEDL